jgi:transketolase N-terminal domain/subunit/transketolase C-terminal domain/subunit
VAHISPVSFANDALRHALVPLLEIKDSDIRISVLEQGRDAVDRGIHAGGAFSAVVPLVALYYSGFFSCDVENPTRAGQDLFVLSKGHAVAPLASIYVDLGYVDRDVLKNSRSVESILNGHPGPLLPGVLISTGPEGHGMPVAQGFAIAGKMAPVFDVFCLTGDGELQAGMIWEAVMYAGAKGLDNLCVIVDKNEGQLDNPKALLFPLPAVDRRFESFGWRAFNVDGKGYEGILEALRRFKADPRDGRPTVIVSATVKGWGAFSSFLCGHKVELPPEIVAQELELQHARREARVVQFLELLSKWEGTREGREACSHIREAAEGMNLRIDAEAGRVQRVEPPVKLARAAARLRRIPYQADELPKIQKGKEYPASWVITEAMRVFARSRRVASVDADLSTTSGLEAGVGWVDVGKALNVGVAESNMMCVGEAFAVLGYNTWVSTFCPFFDWRVLRRIAINFQERMEVIQSGGWLSEGHNLDMTFLATAPDLETRTNGATHMGNDDSLLFGQLGHLKIVTLCCPNQLLGFLRWVMEGGRGLLYARILRAPARALYDGDFSFEYGKGYWLAKKPGDRAYLVSSGRGVHEALQAVALLEAKGMPVGLIDMPSVDETLIGELYESGRSIYVAEQNNGYLVDSFRKVLWRKYGTVLPGRISGINTLDSNGRPQYIHSATYGQLLHRFGLSPELLAERIAREV